ncbi:hypothetical protein W97_06120 [Coniosporium apollinis CBS 100218]|uniref:Nucleoporin Nup159/Nup146 N-terminal domain-containing protein n=1 Tax=Coniosporium apollinis (strain CBS 100218) TaxID=1168221 RepID=R7YYY2_CONA1|nr:uncharacterized protein W97_06120 [Coniosporium apollinis CBS 100218]EON67004.1 hypothetical protein W97_06120 [Coniosporium apollinis CBS 100218]
MAFSFANAAGAGGGIGAAQRNAGPDLEEIQTEQLGFMALAGESKVRLLPTPWPTNALPPPTSSLLSIAQTRGLVAAAGPDALVIAGTETVRKAFGADAPAENNVKPFKPELTVPNPRISQVAFSSDENFLVISAESGGGLAIYEVEKLLQGNKESSFQIGTNGTAVRALAPNPAPENAHYMSIILSNGQLLLADLKARQLMKGPNGEVLKTGVSCVSWSNKGKQLVAGLGDGTAFQMDPQGAGKAEIPRPPQIQGDQHVSSITWLANDDFIVVHYPSSMSQDQTPEPTFHLVHREPKTTNYSYFKLVDPCPPFGMERLPPHYFIQRLRDFPPALNDMLIVSNTAAGQIGLFTRSTTPLTTDAPADKITNTYTTTGIANDNRRAELPVSDEMIDTSPIGMALDLSSKEKVPRPIPSDEEIDYSPTPLPALMVLNHEGVLCAWWVLYNDSIRQKTGYPGLVAASGGQQPAAQPQPTPFASAAPTQQPSAFGSTFAKPAVPAFGSPGLPASSTGSAFGGASALGGSKSPWAPQGTSTTTPPMGGSTFGTPAFGAPAFGKPAAPAFGSTTPFGSSAGGFGAVGGIGQKSSPWGSSTTSVQQPQSNENVKPAPNPFSSAPASTPDSGFAKFSGGNTGALASPFSSFSATNNNNKPSASPFASFTPQKPGQSVFASTPSTTTPGASFGGGSTVGSGQSIFGTSAFGTPSQPTTSVFGKPSVPAQTRESEMGDADEQTPSIQAQDRPAQQPQTAPATNGFKLGSTFKGDGTAKDDLPKPDTPSGSSFFGSGFGGALSESAKPAVPATPVKKEPGTDEGPKLQDISTTPDAVPRSMFGQPSTQPPPQLTPAKLAETPKAKAPSPEPQSPVAEPEAPMPPDPSLFRARQKELEQQTASILGPARSKEPEKQSAPLFQFAVPEEPVKPAAPLFGFPKAKEPQKEEDLPPIAGSPPIKVEKPSSESPSPLPESVDSELEEGEVEEAGQALPESDVEEDQEEEGEEQGVPSPPPPAIRHTQPTTWSFPPAQESKARSPPHSPARPPAAVSNTPAGFPKGPTFHPPTNPNIDTSLRSPSPIRSASAPGFRPARQPPLTVPAAKPIARQASRPSSRLAQPPQEPEYTPEDLSDDEDARIREVLDSDVPATTTLEPFIAHQDYAGRVSKPGIPGQIEKVYRDINSMLDTLGLNARSMKAFVKGHRELYKEEGRSRADLDPDDDEDEEWCLVEIEDLMNVEDALEQHLDQGRVTDVRDKKAEIARLGKDLVRLKQRSTDVRKQVDALSDPENVAAQRRRPLSAEQQAQQQTLRERFAELLKRLREAEEGVTLLRTKLASLPGARSARPAPTVEAVTNTIAKMTDMIQRKSADLDVLEIQMRKLGLAPSGSLGSSVLGRSLVSNGTLDGRRSRDAAFSTPPTSSRARLAADVESAAATPTPAAKAGTGRTYGLFYTPDTSPTREEFGASPGDGVGGGKGAVQGVKGVSAEEVQAYAAKIAARRKLVECVRKEIRARGTRVVEG